MKKRIMLLSFACLIASGDALASAQSAGSADYPLLSQGTIAPPPPPPGYSFSLPAMEPSMAPPPPPSQEEVNQAYNPPGQPVMPVEGQIAPPPAPASQSLPVAPMFVAPPPPPVLPPAAGQIAPPAPSVADVSGAADVPDAARFNQNFAVKSGPEHKVMQLIDSRLAKEVKRLLHSIKTMRTIVDKPESADELRRIQLTGRVCADLFSFRGYPVPSRFAASSNDRILRDRSHDAVEYRHFGDFDNRVNGWIKPVETAIYLDLVFDGRSRRRTHIRAQFTRTGPLTGSFYAYSWDARGNPWKMQGSLENLFVHDDGLPAGGSLKIFGADPDGKTMGLALNFPVKVHGEPEAEKADTRHRTGQRVSVGN